MTDKICALVYEFAILMAVLVIALALTESSLTTRVNFTTVSADRIMFETPGAARALSVGDEAPVYRFNSEWENPIGKVKVVSMEGDRVIAHYAPVQFRWPIGWHGRVVSRTGDAVLLEISQQAGFKPGDELAIFRDRVAVGRVKLVTVAENFTTATILSAPEGDLSGLTVTQGNFLYATQVAFPESKFIMPLQVLVILGSIIAWGVLRRRKVSVFSPMRAMALHMMEGARGRVIAWLFYVALGVPLVMFLAKFTQYSGLFLMHLAGFSQFAWSDTLHQALYINLGIVYYAYLMITRRSPIARFRAFFCYQPPRWERYPVWVKHVVLWTLHLIIAYAFAHTLDGILRANLRNIISIAWSGIALQGQGWGALWAALPQLLDTAPHWETREQGYHLLRLIIWSVAIVVGIFGYGYTVLVEPKKIRNLDFTIAGWVTTGICYAPILGSVLWSSVPDTKGLDPIVATSLLPSLILPVELLLNILYTLSLWNLGKLFGVMTDKGLRTTGFYAVVRHPSYTLESLMFLLTAIIAFTTFGNWLHGLAFLFIYWLRSEREDHFMGVSNPGYADYRKETPYKYIPGVY